jgi:hypothetical protein
MRSPEIKRPSCVHSNRVRVTKTKQLHQDQAIAQQCACHQGPTKKVQPSRCLCTCAKAKFTQTVLRRPLPTLQSTPTLDRVLRMYYKCTKHVVIMHVRIMSEFCTTYVLLTFALLMYYKCTTHVLRMYYACTTHVLQLYRACTTCRFGRLYVLVCTKIVY